MGLGINREQVIAVLRAHEPDLRSRGVWRAALFGSLARGDARLDSDIDILIELDPQAQIDLFDYIGITHFLADLFPSRVDVANLQTLKSHVRPSAEHEAMYAF